jgi:hypothetical protein
MKTTLHRFFSINGIITVMMAVVLSISCVSADAGNHRFSDSWGKQGLTLNRQGTDGISLNFSIQEFGLTSREINGQVMTGIEFSESFLQNEEGAPDLPGFGRYIAIPKGATAVVEITNMRSERYTNIEMAPAPRIPLDTDQGPLHFEKNSEIYTRDAFYPAQPVTLGDFSQIRGVDVAMLGVTPFQYNPVTKELIVYRDMEISVRFEGGSRQFGEDKYRNRWWDPIMEDAIMNFGSLPVIDYDKRVSAATRGTGYEYLIIVPNDDIFYQWADSIKKFRTEEGIYTGIVKLSEIGANVNAAMLETYVNNAYNTWDTPPVAILLLGDYGQATANNNSIISPIYDNYCVSDNILADVSGNHMPDIIFARITAQNADQLASMIGRFLKYERRPPTNPSFYANPITALGWQTERWFQICSETVGGFWKNVLGKTPVRINEIYQGTPGNSWSSAQNTSTVVGVFGPNGLGYIPASPASMGGWSGGNATMINNALNSGSFMLMHRDHGMETGWGEPSYTNSNISSLTNTDLCFILSINCLTGKYNWGSESFTEKFHRYTYMGQPAGALGLIAASEVSYSFVNDTYVWGMMDNMWPNFMPQYGSTPESRGVLPAFGNAAGKYFLRQSSWPYNTGNKEVTYNLFHHHGDAFLRVCTEVPQTIAATYEPTIFENETNFTITASPNSLVCLTSNGVILGTGVTGFVTTISITIPPMSAGDRIKVTITRPNCNRYEGWVDVIPMVTSAIAGEDMAVCEGTEPRLNGAAVNYTSLLWATNGTGTFSDATILDPIYSPSAEDIAQGAVLLSLTASNPAANDSTDYLTLSFSLAPVVFAGNNADICAGEGYSALDATAENYTQLEWTTTGTGSFDDPASLNPRYIPGAEDIENGAAMLTLSAWNELCEPVSMNLQVMIHALPVPVVNGPDAACQYQSELVYAAEGEGNTYFWEIVGGTITAGQNTGSVTVTWDEPGTGSLNMVETNEFGCSGSTDYEITINPAPAPAIDGNALVCANSEQVTYITPLNDGNTYNWTVTGGEIVSGADANEVVVNWGGNGQGTLSLVETNTVTTCSAAADYSVMINSPETTLSNDTTICITHVLNIEAEDGFAAYAWSSGQDTRSIQVNGEAQGLNTTTYTVTVTDANNCTGTASIMVTVDACAGIEENATATRVTIFPNPNMGEFTLEISNAEPGKSTISIVTTTGEMIYSNQVVIGQQSYRQNIGLNAGSGVYFLKVETTNGTTIQKLVIR